MKTRIGTGKTEQAFCKLLCHTKKPKMKTRIAMREIKKFCVPARLAACGWRIKCITAANATHIMSVRNFGSAYCCLLFGNNGSVDVP